MPEEHWAATSRNWWYQGLLKSVLQVYPGFGALNYLLAEIVAVGPEAVGPTGLLLKRLLDTIEADPLPFIQLEYTESDPDIVRQQVAEAQILRSLDDDSRYAFGNFFSFLKSQAAALEEAQQKGWALLSLQPQPDVCEQRLIWPV